jgi:hypothetical protein
MSQGPGVFKMNTPGGHYSTLKDEDHDHIPLQTPSRLSRGGEEFNPYDEVTGPDYRASYSAYDGLPAASGRLSADFEHGIPAHTQPGEAPPPASRLGQ